MGGTLFIREDVTWMPSAGMVSLILEELAAEVKHADPELSNELLNPSKGHGWGVYDFRPIEERQFKLLNEGMQRAYERTLSKETQVVDRAESYFFYVRLLSLFKALLYVDPRARQNLSATGLIIIRNDVKWVAPAWVYDFTLEYLAAFARASTMPTPETLAGYVREIYDETLGIKRTEDIALAEFLLAARSVKGGGECDLSSLEAERFQQLLAAVKFMVNDCYYLGTKADQEKLEILVHIEQLKPLLEEDGRSN